MKELKIYGVYNEKGSSYHRVKLPLEAINGNIVVVDGEERLIKVEIGVYDKKLDISEEVFKNNDVVYWNWLIEGNVIDISQWKSKYNTKLIVDIDDVWNDNTHYYFNPLWEENVVKTVILADFVTTTNNYLAFLLFPYNQNIGIIPNFLPVGKEQFVGKPEDKKFNGKLRIGLFGSHSHTLDYMLFKQVLNRLAKNKNIVENCEFVLAGVVDKEIVDMFKKKKHIKLNILRPKPVEQYMELLNDVDVICQPLVKNSHNIGKSGLKIIESSIKDCILLGSELYSQKEFTTYFKCETTIEYEKTIEYLLEEGNFEKTLKEVKESNLADNKWEERVNFQKEVISKVLELNTSLENVKIWGITYKDGQTTEYEKVFNPKREKAWRFEYNVMIDKLQEIKDGKEEYYGFLSWKYPFKTGLYKNILYKMLEQKQFKEYDVINLNRRFWSSTEKYLEFSYKQHPKLEEILLKVLSNLGRDYVYSNNYTYSNFYLMKKDLWVDYLENWIVPSLNYMENEIWDEVNVDANYKTGISKEELIENTGLEFYNYVTFVLERLVVFFMKDKKVLDLL